MMNATHNLPPPVPLIRIEQGALVRIVALMGGSSFNKRMAEVGLNVGAELIVHQFTGGGMVLLRGETRIALGGGMANKVLVIPVKEKSDHKENQS